MTTTLRTTIEQDNGTYAATGLRMTALVEVTTELPEEWIADMHSSADALEHAQDTLAAVHKAEVALASLSATVRAEVRDRLAGESVEFEDAAKTIRDAIHAVTTWENVSLTDGQQDLDSESEAGLAALAEYATTGSIDGIFLCTLEDLESADGDDAPGLGLPVSDINWTGFASAYCASREDLSAATTETCKRLENVYGVVETARIVRGVGEAPCGVSEALRRRIESEQDERRRDALVALDADLAGEQ